jgi:GNAT superfamily N-acetyltransferase
VTAILLPDGDRFEVLQREHSRRGFRCGVVPVDDWLATKALQNQEKHLSVTKVLLDPTKAIAGYYTLATGQVDFGDLPPDLTQRLPRRFLPVAVLAWLGVSSAHQRQGLGRLLVARALRECYDAAKTFAFIAVMLDCINDSAREFYRQWDFEELPGHPYRLFLSTHRLNAMMQKP